MVDKEMYKYYREVLKTSLENMMDIIDSDCQNYFDCEVQCPNYEICVKMQELYTYIVAEEIFKK